MLTAKTVIESIADGASMSDVMEYVASWIGEARTLADALDGEFFTNGLPEAEKEDPHAFFGRVTASFHTLEMTLDWIQNAVEAAGGYIFCKEKEEQERARAEAEAAEQAAAGAGNILPITDGKRGRKK